MVCSCITWELSVKTVVEYIHYFSSSWTSSSSRLLGLLWLNDLFGLGLSHRIILFKKPCCSTRLSSLRSPWASWSLSSFWSSYLYLSSNLSWLHRIWRILRALISSKHRITLIWRRSCYSWFVWLVIWRSCRLYLLFSLLYSSFFSKVYRSFSSPPTSSPLNRLFRFLLIWWSSN